jgi:polyhydroxybutyrate depolymerase
MLNFSRHSIALGIAVLSLSLTAPSFGWSISGTVKNTMGQPLGGVKIESFNVSGVSAFSADDGTFNIDESTIGLYGVKNSDIAAHFADNTLYLENVNANVLKVAVIDALGKVIYQQSMQQVHGNVSFSLKGFSHGTRFLRLSLDGKVQSYQVMGQGSLLKTGSELPSLIFTKEGYATAGHQMTQENEVGVVVTMEPATTTGSSASNWNFTNSSSSNAQSSTFTPPTVPTNCAGKTLNSSTTLYVDNRKVIVTFPNGYTGDKPVPMLVNFHPIQGSADGWSGQSQIAQKALADGVINVFPDGAAHPGMFGMQGQAWNVGPCCTDANDTSFARHIVEKMVQEACVDPTRVYAAGFSMGGGMSNFVGCFLADIFAAAAPSAFDLAKEIVDGGLCNPVRPFPILNLRGRRDGTVSYDGGLSSVVTGKPITFMGAENNFQEWAKMDQCTGNPTQSNTSGGGECKIYENCAGGAKVGLCSYNADHQELDPDAAWNFLKQFKLQ